MSYQTKLKRIWRLTHWIIQNGKCFYCQEPVAIKESGGSSCERNAATLDHLIPKSKNGRRIFINFVVACADCNQARGNKELT